MANEEFYIGWQGNMPKKMGKFLFRIVIVLMLISMIVAWLLAYSQKKFGTGVFEFGKLTQLTGQFSNKPVPSLLVKGEKDLFGNQSSLTIPLIGFGKFGATGVLKKMESESGVNFESKIVTLKGTLLYNQGKLLMQIDENDEPFVKIEEAPVGSTRILEKDLGEITVSGEIVDPKCFFGVMKPGQGKVHKDCAIRCILGGIPPVLRVPGADEGEQYYLIAGPKGEPLNNEIQNWVAQPIQIKAHAVKINDWTVLYADPSSFTAISRRDFYLADTKAIVCGIH